MPVKLVKSTPEDKSQIQSNILKGLNPEQQKGVTVIDGPVLVVAGAGSGKTRVLTNRIAYLIQNGIAPYNILALTFTNKAADEMKDRISKITGEETAKRVWAGTFHSIFAKILRIEAVHLGYTSSFSIYDSDEQLSVIKKILNDLNYSQKEFSPSGIQNIISNSKNRMISWQKFSDSAEIPFHKIAAQVFQQYENRLLANNAMDFDDLLINIIHLFERFPDILKKYQEKFRYILVDEYQDTNRAQYISIKQLSSAYHNIFVVGDDAQSIYRWRGADINNILDFQKDYPESKIIRLEQNYRSTKTILSAADSIIKKNINQIPKTLWTDNVEGELIDVIECSDDREESEKIVSLIESDKRKRNYLWNDYAVLYRTNAQSLALENAFRKDNIPYIIIGGISFYKRKEIKDVLAYLKLLVNPKDSESLERIINEPTRGIGPTTLLRVRHYAREHSISVFESIKDCINIPNLQDRARMALFEFYELIQKYLDTKQDADPVLLIKDYISETGIPDMYREIGSEDANDRYNNVEQLLSNIIYFFKQNPDLQLEDFLQQISLLSDIDTANTSANNVKLMTLHAAKGLEFPVVFIAGLEQGLFPLIRAEQTHEEEEEERRLFYVGITRAEEKLHLLYARRRMRFGDFVSQSPSKFIKDIKPDYVNWQYDQKQTTVSFEPVYVKEKSYDQTPRIENYSQMPIKTTEIMVGDRVHHSLFGEGIVKSIAGFGVSKQATVNFSKSGVKKLILQYAKLEKIR